MASEIKNAHGTHITHSVAAVLVHGQVIASGQASSSKNAKVKAAQMALEELKGLAPYEFRAKYKCGCQPEEAGGKGMEEVGTAI